MKIVLVSHEAEKEEMDKFRNYLDHFGIKDFIEYKDFEEFENRYHELDEDDFYIYFSNVAVRYRDLEDLIKVNQDNKFEYVNVDGQLATFRIKELAVDGGILSFPSNRKKFFFEAKSLGLKIRYFDNSIKHNVKYTGERILPKLGNGNIDQHWYIYNRVIPLIYDKNVLDIASGAGWGSYLISKYAKQVTAMDISEDAVNYASNTYKRDNLQFKQGSILDIPEQGFDVVCSIETFEHVPHEDIEKLVSECYRVLNKGGHFIFSTPDGHIYPYHPKDKSEIKGYHMWHYTKQEIKELLEPVFDYVKIYRVFKDTYLVYCYKK